MSRLRRASPTAPLWLFAFALLLRAAMPFLADASAEWQGRALGEVCSVYGVALDAKRHDAPDAPDAPGHGSDHCVLGALAALGTAGTPPPLGLPQPTGNGALPSIDDVAAARPDATAAWVARRKHGPPSLA